MADVAGNKECDKYHSTPVHGVSVYGSSSVEGIIWLERGSVLGRGWGWGRRRQPGKRGCFEKETQRERVVDIIGNCIAYPSAQWETE